jgi:Ca2+-binding RTX toxin-like protein
LNGTPSDDLTGLLIRKSSDVSVANSEFHELWNGIAFLDSDHVLIQNNKFHDIRTDGVRGGGTSDIKILNNSFTDFYPVAGDHPDAIQFWTTNTTASARNIEVSGNVYTRGNGGIVQGIFFRDQVGNLPFENVTISNNLVVGGMYNGIAVLGATNLKISGNTVAAFGDQDSWIRVERTDLAFLSDNNAFKFLFTDASRVTDVGNTTIGRVADGGAALLQEWTSGEVAAGMPVSYTPPPPPSIVKTVVGTSGDDRLTVSGTVDTILQGGAGSDTLTGGAGKNTLIGGIGDDTYIIKDADDQIVELAGEGMDTVWASFDYVLGSNLEVLRLSGNARVGTGNELDNRIIGTDFNDRLSGLAGNDKLQGGAGHDTLLGGSGDDELQGNEGDDVLVGDAGADRLIGGAGADRLEGGEGNDTLEGGLGADMLVGGLGADRFFYRNEHLDGAVDTIADFSSAQGDRILLTSIDANVSTSIDDKFVFIGTAKFGGKAGELRYEVKDGAAWVYGDTNGDGISDFTLRLTGVTSLTANDFML